MRAVPFAFPASRRLAWLLWLALLLPVAQAATHWHGLSHPVAPHGAPASDQPALHLVDCDLCLSAATLHAGALPSTSALLPRIAAGGARLLAAADGAFVAAPLHTYLSRAPPATPR